MKERYFGCHVSAAGGLEHAIKHAEELGINTIQLHPSAPQRWNTKAFPEGIERAFKEARAHSGVKKVFFHGIYLINLANPNPQQFHLSKQSLVYYLELNERLAGDGVIFHVGSLKDQPDEKIGYARAAEGINWILEHAEGNAQLLLEVAAGSGSVIGDRFEDLAQIYEMVEQKDRVGFALDTQHMWASGFALDSELDGVINEADSVLSLSKIKAIHLNDSKTERGSRKDRHENIGDGLIGKEAMRKIFTHPRLLSIPFILETPALKDIEGAKGEIAKLRDMA